MKNIPSLILICLTVACLFAAACRKDRNPEPTPDPETEIPSTFNYATTKSLNVSVRLISNNDKPIQGAVVSIADPENPEHIFLRAVSDAQGFVNSTVNVPSYLDTLLLTPNYIGLVSSIQLSAKKNTVSAIIGGKSMAIGDIILPDFKATKIDNNVLNAKMSVRDKDKSATVTPFGLFTVTYGYPSPYNSTSEAVVSSSTYPANLGRPKYLEATPDAIDPSLLSYVNASLPEGTPLTTTHPEFLTTSVGSNIVITQTSDVWITFLSEGAGNLNTLGFYTYDTSNPPTSVTLGTALGGIDKVTMIFPNSSAYLSGGGLISGDKVNLGRFDAGTTIAFVLFQNGWTGSGVSTSSTKYYSESKFNPESTTARKKHSVMLYDDVHKLFLFGFEDINRDGGSDNDFNDLVFYATSNPVTGISTGGVAPIDKGGDSDGDGVLDAQDDFPNDASRAYITYSPSSTGWSTLAFEDNWPTRGDYDLNDLVVNYRYTFIKNAKNEVLEMTGEYQPVAAGAENDNGFGVQLPIAASRVSSVTGQSITGSYIQMAGNGVEAGQTNAVLIPFDNHENLLKNADRSGLVNTDPNKVKVTPSKATVVVKFSSPVGSNDLGTAPFNPFLISNLRRGYEIHLPNYAPTSKVTTALFGTGDDRSSPSTSRYYLSAENLPWAIHFPDAFRYPIETRRITDVYLRFQEWAVSGGTAYRDWYSNTAAGYRNTNLIYNK